MNQDSPRPARRRFGGFAAAAFIFASVLIGGGVGMPSALAVGPPKCRITAADLCVDVNAGLVSDYIRVDMDLFFDRDAYFTSVSMYVRECRVDITHCVIVARASTTSHINICEC